MSCPAFFVNTPHHLKRNSKELQRWVPAIITSAVLLLVWSLQLLSSLSPGLSVLNRVENISYDWRVRWMSQRDTPICTDLVAVAIDDLAHESVSLTYDAIWPWPRHIHGQLVEELAAEGARVIAFDILFLTSYPAWSDELENNLPIPSDTVFSRKLANAGNVLLASSTSTNSSGGWNMEVPFPLLATNSAGIGHIVSDVDRDGVLRRVKVLYETPDGKRYWHLAVHAAAKYLGLDVDNAEILPDRIILRGPGGIQRTIPVDSQGYLYVDWVLGKHEAEERRIIMPFTEFLQRHIKRNNGEYVDGRDIMGAVVFVGSLGSGNNISDTGATPLASKDFLFTTHWNVANSIIQNQFVKRSSPTTEILLTLLIACLSATVTWRMRMLWASSVLTLSLGAYFLLALGLFASARYWLPIAVPTTTLLLTHLSLVTYRGVVEQRERFRVKEVFSKVVAPDVVNELLNSEAVSFGGSRRRVSIFFADIRGFTKVTDEGQAEAERYATEQGLSHQEAEAYLDAQARDILHTVNLYLGAVADTIKQHHGTFDKYIGDCVMAFWGAPTPNEHHAADCVRAAIQAQQAIFKLNQKRQAENLERARKNAEPSRSGLPPLRPLTLLDLGTGINTGTVTVGLMGSDQHVLNYTVFGREVNLASRLEGTSGSGRIVISQSTFNELLATAPDLVQACQSIPPVQVKGFREPISIYEVDWQSHTPPPH